MRLFAGTCGICKQIMFEDQEVRRVWLPPDPAWGTNYICHKDCADFFEWSRPDEATRKRRHEEIQDANENNSNSNNDSDDDDSGSSNSP